MSLMHAAVPVELVVSSCHGPFRHELDRDSQGAWPVGVCVHVCVRVYVCACVYLGDCVNLAGGVGPLFALALFAWELDGSAPWVLLAPCMATRLQHFSKCVSMWSARVEQVRFEVEDVTTLYPSSGSWPVVYLSPGACVVRAAFTGSSPHVTASSPHGSPVSPRGVY